VKHGFQITPAPKSLVAIDNFRFFKLWDTIFNYYYLIIIDKKRNTAFMVRISVIGCGLLG